MHQLIIREDIVILFIFLVIGVRKIKNIKSQAYYNKIVIFKNKVKIELPTILISLFLFLTLWIFFGKYNAILPPFLTLFFKIKHTQDFRANELIKNYLLFLFIALMSFLAGQTLILCIVLNLFIPFIIFCIWNGFCFYAVNAYFN